jgi:hypothetical protein
MRSASGSAFAALNNSVALMTGIYPLHLPVQAEFSSSGTKSIWQPTACSAFRTLHSALV